MITNEAAQRIIYQVNNPWEADLNVNLADMEYQYNKMIRVDNMILPNIYVYGDYKVKKRGMNYGFETVLALEFRAKKTGYRIGTITGARLKTPLILELTCKDLDDNPFDLCVYIKY